MADKVYKSSTSARSEAYQDVLLAAKVPGWPNVTIYRDGEREGLIRPTTRKIEDSIYAASFACFADNESDLVAFLRACKDNGRRVRLIGIEEDFEWYPQRSLSIAINAWKAARRSGASKRGAEMSAASKKAKTAARLKLIEDDLKKDEYTTRELLERVGVKSVNSIKNTYGISREEMQRRYRAELKRKERREAYNAARA